VFHDKKLRYEACDQRSNLNLRLLSARKFLPLGILRSYR
jgi:hypothetical protein